jgi:type III restriction enzyme
MNSTAIKWCERIKRLNRDQRMERNWHYVLLGEASFYEWRDKGARLVELLQFARIRHAPGASNQGQLALS